MDVSQRARAIAVQQHDRKRGGGRKKDGLIGAMVFSDDGTLMLL